MTFSRILARAEMRRILPTCLALLLLKCTLASELTEQIDRACQSPPRTWEATQAGTVTRTADEPQAAAIGQRLAIGFAQAYANQTVAPAPAATTFEGERQLALQRLRQTVGDDVSVHLRSGAKTVMQIRARMLEPAVTGVSRINETARVEQTARNFLRTHKEVFNLIDPDGELVLQQQSISPTGERHLHFAQRHEGIPVWPSGLTAHFDRQGNVTVIDGAYIASPRALLTEPGITAEEAAAQARTALRGGPATLTLASDLIVFGPLHDEPRLAWKLTVVTGLAQAWDVIVDAQDGRILKLFTRIYDNNLKTSGVDLAGVSHDLEVWSEGGKYYLADTTKQMFNAASNPITDPRGVISIFDAANVTLNEIKTFNIVESTAATTWIPEGVSALYNFGLTYDYFLERFNRNSLDGRGENIQAVVRVAQLDNAFWDGTVRMMFFGAVRAYPLAMDVVGHELTHGVTENTAALVYELEPGALNESFSDIFGEMVEARALGANDWKMGEQLNQVYRDFKDPGSIQITRLNRPYPAKMSEYIDLPNDQNSDYGGVHLNSSILNHCFYLLAEGLPDALGLRDAEQIFYRCLTEHLQSQSQFVDARLGCIAAAEALFGPNSRQAKKTAEAFDAVEIVATPPTPEPPSIPSVSGPDSTLFITVDPFTDNLMLARYETALADPDYGFPLAEPIKEARVAVSGDGKIAVFVNALNDLCMVSTADPTTIQCVGFPGTVHAVALAPDGTRAAFVLLDPTTGNPDNRISVYEFATGKAKTFDLLAPVTDGNPVDHVLYAESMVFSSDGKELIYDAAASIRFGNRDPVERWSIARINLATETTTILVPPLETRDCGNPNMGRAGNRYLAFDARDSKTGEDVVLTLDLFTGNSSEIATVGGDALGYPCFTGDEGAIIYTAGDADAEITGLSLYKQDLTPDRLGKSGTPTLWLQDGGIGVIYRRGTFIATNQAPSATLIAPANNATFPSGSTVTITAQAADPDGTIAKVEFYAGDTKVGEAAAQPYSCVWANPPAGTHRLLARAYDNLGATTDSVVVEVTIGAGQQLFLSAQRGTSRVRMTLRAPAGNYRLQRSSDLRTWSDLQQLIVGADGSTAAEDDQTQARMFYRVRQ